MTDEPLTATAAGQCDYEAVRERTKRVAEQNDWGCVCGAKVRPGSGEIVVCDSPHAAIHGCPYGGVFEGFLPEVKP